MSERGRGTPVTCSEKKGHGRVWACVSGCPGHNAPLSWAVEAGAGPRPILSSIPGLFSWHLEDSTYPSSYTSLTLVTKWPTDI